MQHTELEFPPCNFCGSNSYQPLFKAHDLLHGIPGEYSVVECQKCRLLRTFPRPTIQSIGQYYPSNYGPYISTQVSERNNGWLSCAKKVAHYFFNPMANAVPDCKPGVLLEIGCASGSFLREMAVKGWSVTGVEFNEEAALQARNLGYTVEIGQLESLDLPADKYDLIVGWMVVEHLHRPLDCLKKLRTSAKSGAMLAISIPNAGSLEFRVFRENWYALQVPTHLYHFTATTIKSTLAAAGWQVTRIKHQRTLSNLIASLGYSLRNIPGFGRIGSALISYPENQSFWRYLLFPFAYLFSLAGQTGRMTVWAVADKVE